MAANSRAANTSADPNRRIRKAPLGDIQRISEQLDNYVSSKRHVINHTIEEMQFYPGHDKRRETAEYSKVHKRLVHEMDLPCLVCGVRNSTLKTPRKNPYGARALETHHHIIEWALQNAVDVAKFNSILRPHLAHRHPNDPVWRYEKPFSRQRVRDWVDHSEHNLWVLCDVHHRAKYHGIHEITYPIWSPANLLIPDFEAWANREISRLRRHGPRIAKPVGKAKRRAAAKSKTK